MHDTLRASRENNTTVPDATASGLLDRAQKALALAQDLLRPYA
jgi:hypothetical protein